MDRTVARVIGAVAMTGTLATAEAAQRPDTALQASSYADLLKPIPNALVTEAAARSVVSEAPPVAVTLAQDHHHHHHRIYHRRHHHY